MAEPVAQSSNLNLARKWRSRSFDDMIGQDLSIRMLKNSLYRGHFFPVYLFSGQRGCGKTTAARVFSAAINCEQLQNFQKDPRNYSLPCLSCTSCTSMAAGKHPDFIEIDAASHTGVDNVRQIIDAASLLPVLGRKKIYLIDEAHMLSKAAFNAFLKILEEPPESVFFILATTDPQKIVDTVRSRCFQVLFRSVEKNTLAKHLAVVCEKEGISYEPDGIATIVSHSQGSVRDALNLLEQVRFSGSSVTKKRVLEVVGYMDDERVVDLLASVLNDSPADFLAHCSQISLDSFTPHIVWTLLIDCARQALLMKCGVNYDAKSNEQKFKKAFIANSAKQFHYFLQMLYQNELLFFKTTTQYQFMEMILLSICQKINGVLDSAAKTSKTVSQPAPVAQKVSIDSIEKAVGSEQTMQDNRWDQFLQKVHSLNDPLLVSIFSQGQFLQYSVESKIVHISFPQNFSFFKETIDETRQAWEAILNECFSSKVELNVSFSTEKKSVVVPDNVQKNLEPIKRPVVQSHRSTAPNKKEQYGRYTAKSSGNSTCVVQNKEKKIDVSDSQKWQKTHMVLQEFPGTVYEIPEEQS